jgi:hypothetical protein
VRRFPSWSARLDRGADDASAARFDDIPADDLIRRPVCALDEHIRLQCAVIAWGVSSSKITTASTAAGPQSARRAPARVVDVQDPCSPNR